MWSGFTKPEIDILGKTLDTFHATLPVDHGEERRRRRRRQDHQVDPGRQRARRRAVVHRRQDRHLLRQQGLDRPRPLHQARTRSTSEPDPQGLARPTPSSTASAARCRRSPTPTGSTTTPTCCKAAGYTEPPKTATELLDMAVKLTKYNSDGSIKVAGFVPLWGFYEMAPAHVAPLWGATWADSRRQEQLRSRPATGRRCCTFQKKFVDAIGYDKLRRFTSGAGDSEFAATNLFETGKLAMNLDGEYRTAFIQRRAPEAQVRHRADPGRRRPAEPVRRGLRHRQLARHPARRRPGATARPPGS